MPIEKTLSIIKHAAVAKTLIGKIYQRFEDAGLKIGAIKMLHLTKKQAEEFYGVHKDKPFFEGLIKFMTSGPIIVQVLIGENAIIKNREIMGATNPISAAAGTLRYDFGTSIEANVVHGSDALETAKFEVAYFFKPEEIQLF